MYIQVFRVSFHVATSDKAPFTLLLRLTSSWRWYNAVPTSAMKMTSCKLTFNTKWHHPFRLFDLLSSVIFPSLIYNKNNNKLHTITPRHKIRTLYYVYDFCLQFQEWVFWLVLSSCCHCRIYIERKTMTWRAVCSLD